MRCLSTLAIVLCSVCATAAPRADSLLLQWAADGGLPTYEATTVQVFTNGTDKFKALLADIAAARRSVDVEYFVYANDSIAHAMTALLVEKAQQGVAVRLLVDDYKASVRRYGYNDGYLHYLRSCGVAIRMFDPWRFPYVNHLARDHRKIVVVDDTIGYIGGLNVADYYVRGDSAIYGAWRDTHVRMTGKIAVGLRQMFVEMYKRAGDGLSDSHDSPNDGCSGDIRAMRTANDASNGITTDVLTANDRSDTTPAVVVIPFERSRECRAKKSETRRAYVAAFQSARTRIRIVNPYFMPTTSVRRALVEAIDRGVEVEILLSHDSDEPTINKGCVDFARRLARHGARVYLYRGAFHHSKILMIDGETAMVGSANMNSRSLRWDYEASCFILSADVTRELEMIFERDKQQSDTLTDDYYRSIPLRSRFVGSVVNHLLTPFL